QGCLLQGFERREASAAALIFSAADIQFLGGGLQRLAFALQAACNLVELLLIGFGPQLELSQLLCQSSHILLQATRVEAATLPFPAPQAVTEALHALLQMADP